MGNHNGAKIMGDYKTNMERITELANTFINFTDSVLKRGDGVVGYRGEDDMEVESFGLFKNKHVAVARIEMPAGFTFASHNHNEKEFVVVYEGDITFITDEGVYNLGVGDSIMFGLGARHSNTTKSGCKIIAITIPASPDYP